MKQVIMFILAIGILFACGKKDKKPRLRIKKLKLTEASLYDERLVQDVLFEAEGNNIDSLKKAGKKYFLEGIDYYRNQHMPGMAVKRFKRALLVVPDPKVYYELGNALADLNNAKEALDAYEMAITTGFEPQANVYTRMAALQYQQYKRLKGTSDNIGLWRTLQSLEKLIMATGGLDTAKLYKDPQWAGIQDEHEYQEMLIGIEAKKLNASDGSLFGLFKHSFTNDASALEIAPEKVDMKDYQRSISYDFEPYVPEMQNASFGRDVNHDFYYVGKVKETSSYTALLYSSVTFTYEAMQPVYTRLVVYNNLGNVVSSKMIGCQCTPEKIKSFSINGDRITVEDYKRVWEKPYKDEGFEHNSIKEHQLLGKAVFRINEQGEIVDEDVPANYTDTNLFVKGN